MIEAAALLSALVQKWEDFAIILIMLLVNAGLDFFQEHRALNALAALKASLAVVACPPVLEQYEAFVRVFKQAARDNTFADDEEGAISHQLARLTIAIREDLMGELDAQSDYSRRISEQIIENSDLQNSRPH